VEENASCMHTKPTFEASITLNLEQWRILSSLL